MAGLADGRDADRRLLAHRTAVLADRTRRSRAARPAAFPAAGVRGSRRRIDAAAEVYLRNGFVSAVMTTYAFHRFGGAPRRVQSRAGGFTVRHARVFGPALAFALGYALALPLVARSSLLGPICSRTGATGAYLKLQVVGATRDGTPVAPPADFTPYLQNTSTSDAAQLHAVLLDVGDSASSPSTFPDKTVRRLP
jgi:hypothetical protein